MYQGGVRGSNPHIQAFRYQYEGYFTIETQRDYLICQRLQNY